MWSARDPVRKKNQAKPKTVVKENCGFVMHVKDIFCKNNWVKTVSPAISSGKTPFGGHSRQQDDQNINNRQNLV